MTSDTQARALAARGRLRLPLPRSGSQQALDVIERLTNGDLQARCDASSGRLGEAVNALAERYAAADPAAVDAEIAVALAAVETITGERDAAKMELHTLTVELGVGHCTDPFQKAARRSPGVLLAWKRA